MDVKGNVSEAARKWFKQTGKWLSSNPTNGWKLAIMEATSTPGDQLDHIAPEVENLDEPPKATGTEPVSEKAMLSGHKSPTLMEYG